MSRIEIKADATGTVWKIEKAVGEQIQEGDEIMILESMKMEIPAIAEESGKLVEISVAETDFVTEGQVLAVVESE